MRLPRFLLISASTVKLFKNGSLHFIFPLLLTALPVVAETLTAQVSDGLGGHITVIPKNLECAPYCTLQVPHNGLASLFAIPDKGYRFEAREGACQSTLGPLCTLNVSGDLAIGARFVKSEASPKPSKALLLLPDEGQKPTVWNDFAKRYFNDRCPVIYGGVILGDDSVNRQNKVYCYRVAFGYYAMLKAHQVVQDAIKPNGKAKKKRRISSTQLGNEVRAAVLGTLAKHPNASLVLVGQASGGLAAQAFLQMDTTERQRIVGLVDLGNTENKSIHDSLAESLPGLAFDRIVHLKAKPSQDSKISAAINQLTKTWWKIN